MLDVTSRIPITPGAASGCAGQRSLEHKPRSLEEDLHLPIFLHDLTRPKRRRFHVDYKLRILSQISSLWQMSHSTAIPWRIRI
jgi:hypothetical protein